MKLEYADAGKTAAQLKFRPKACLDREFLIAAPAELLEGRSAQEGKT